MKIEHKAELTRVKQEQVEIWRYTLICIQRMRCTAKLSRKKMRDYRHKHRASSDQVVLERRQIE